MSLSGQVYLLAQGIASEFNKRRPVVGDMPLTPFEGQIWFDDANNRAWIRVGTDWRPFQAQATFDAFEPPLPGLGDLWIKPDKSLWFYNGIDFDELIGTPSAPTALHRAEIRTSTDQAITSGQATSVVPIDFTTTTYAVGCTVSLAGNSITITKDGFYNVGGICNFNLGASGRRIVDIRKNGGIIARAEGGPVAQSYICPPVSVYAELVAGDVITLTAYAGAVLTLKHSDVAAYLAVTELPVTA